MNCPLSGKKTKNLTFLKLMAVPYSPTLKIKSALLKQQKDQWQKRFLWRSILLTSLVSSLLAITIIPQGKIKHPNQVQIKGTELVTNSTIYRLLNVPYSQFIWQIPTHRLSQNLESIPAIADVKISKKIFPPLLQIFIEERNPVALAVSQSTSDWGFLDAEGILLDPQYYEPNRGKILVSQLKVINFDPSYASLWSEIYSLVKSNPNIRVKEVQWDKSRNLYLKTDLGKVYLGSDSSRLPEQFAAIANLKNLPKYLNPSEIHYIDLTNPDRYSIQKYSQK